MSNPRLMLISAATSEPKRPVHQLLSLAPGILVGLLIGLLLAPPYGRQTVCPAAAAQESSLSNVDLLTSDEIQTLLVKALSRLAEQQRLPSAGGSKTEDGPRERGASSWQDIEMGIENIRRLLPSAKRLTVKALHEAAVELKPSDWPGITRLIGGVIKIGPSQHLRGIAGVRDDRLSEILVDPTYAPYLTSDDESIFVLAHELTHVAARSGKLNRFIEGVAEKAGRTAHVEPTEDQKEDLACDFIGELVLKRFITRNPTNESVAVRVSRVFGYESPAERFARAWEDFCASYNGDPGDEDHLTQYQTIRALLGLDPQLQPLMPMRGNAFSSSGLPETTDCR